MHDASHTSGRRNATLVTGATGFIGRKLVASLLEAQRTVRVLVRRREQAAELGPVEIFVGDLRDAASLTGIEHGVDEVLHCASLLGKWGTDEQLIHDVNADGPVRLLERFRGTGLRRFVHLSAGGVTGPVGRDAVDETYDCRPATAYEATKLLGERRVLELARRESLPAVVVRPTFTYGPGDPHKLALFRAVQKGRYAFIGDGLSVNHPVFVDDLIHGLGLALEKARPGEVYIIGGERPVTKRELVHTIADTLQVPRPKFRIPRPLAAVAAAGFELAGRTLGFEPLLTRSRVMMMADNFGYSIEKAMRELGYRPQTALAEGIKKTVEAYVASGLL